MKHSVDFDINSFNIERLMFYLDFLVHDLSALEKFSFKKPTVLGNRNIERKSV